jgi:hypothetical protein
MDVISAHWSRWVYIDEACAGDEVGRVRFGGGVHTSGNVFDAAVGVQCAA